MKLFMSESERCVSFKKCAVKLSTKNLESQRVNDEAITENETLAIESI